MREPTYAERIEQLAQVYESRRGANYNSLTAWLEGMPVEAKIRAWNEAIAKTNEPNRGVRDA